MLDVVLVILCDVVPVLLCVVLLLRLWCVCVFFVCGVAWLGVYWFRCVVVCFVGCVCGDV